MCRSRIEQQVDRLENRGLACVVRSDEHGGWLKVEIKKLKAAEVAEVQT